MSGVLNPIIGTLIELDSKLRKMIENTVSGHECWNSSLTESYAFPNRGITPYINADKYLPVMKQFNSGFSSSLVNILVRKPNGSLALSLGFFVKPNEINSFHWLNRYNPEIRIQGVIGWKPFY